MNSALHIIFTPVFPPVFMGVAAAGITIITGYALSRRAKGAVWRGLALLLIWAAMLNPSLIHDERAPLKDTALIVVDDSASMKLGDRATQAKDALDALTKKLSAQPELDIETLHVSGNDSTNLHQAVAQKLSTLPHDRVAGIIAITDGQIHDTPTPYTVPFHALIAGHKHEIDRRLTITQSPAYGMVGTPINVTLRVDDTPEGDEKVPVTLTRDDGSSDTYPVPVGRDVQIEVTPAHAGANRFAFTAAPLPNEITTINNAALVNINGIRER